MGKNREGGASILGKKRALGFGTPKPFFYPNVFARGDINRILTGEFHPYKLVRARKGLSFSRWWIIFLDVYMKF